VHVKSRRTVCQRVVHGGIGIAPGAKTVTCDFARLMDGSKQVSCPAVGEAIIEHM
jgi:isocitrate dehydrogenase